MGDKAVLSLSLVDKNGVKTPLPPPLSFEINRELGAADDMSLSLALRSIPESSGCGIELERDGAIIFTGIIDEAIQCEGSRSAPTRIYSRGKAALLLDNEAEPLDYKNAGAALIARRHISPFGLDFICDDDGEYTDLNIYKGMSHWQVIKSFCSRCYSSLPYLDESGRVILRRASVPSLYFSNDNGISYTEARINRRYYRLISSVHTRPPHHDGYDIETTNPTAEHLGIVRTRYVDSVSGSVGSEDLISSGSLGSLVVKISSPEFLLCPLGSRIKIKLDSGRVYDGLKCSRVKQSLGSNGFFTQITAEGEIKIDK